MSCWQKEEEEEAAARYSTCVVEGKDSPSSSFEEHCTEPQSPPNDGGGRKGNSYSPAAKEVRKGEGKSCFNLWASSTRGYFFASAEDERFPPSFFLRLIDTFFSAKQMSVHVTVQGGGREKINSPYFSRNSPRRILNSHLFPNSSGGGGECGIYFGRGGGGGGGKRRGIWKFFPRFSPLIFSHLFTPPRFPSS